METFTKSDLRMAFAMGIDFADVNEKSVTKHSKYRDLGFDNFFSQLKSIRSKERSSGILHDDEHPDVFLTNDIL